MKLKKLEGKHIHNAAKLIDSEGIPKDFVWSQYYVVVDFKEYPFNHIVRTAYNLAFKEELKFESNYSYRNDINSLGFEVRYYAGGYNFFSKEELEFYSSVYGKDYRKNNPDQSNYGKKLYPINRKLKYWLDQIKPPEYKIRYDGKWLGVDSKVSPYLWPRLYKGEDKDIFFNAEVAAYDKFIGIKLDGYYSTSKKLPDQKINLLNQFKDDPANGWWWLKIPFNELDDYNWDRLIKESKRYIKEQIPNHDYLKNLLSREKRISRITWNTNGWVRPSGKEGKSKNKSFEFDHGFGHEEWLFDGDKIIDGYKYGFLEPVHKHRSKYEGLTFDLLLYTRDSETNECYWVTTLNNVEIIKANEADWVLSYYREKDWYQQMKRDLRNLNLDYAQLDSWVNEGAENLFNIKFKSSQLQHIPSDMIRVENKSEIPSDRYTLLNTTITTETKIENTRNVAFSFEDSGNQNLELPTHSSHTRKSREIELELKHNLLQKKFLSYLQKEYGKSVVKRECTAYGGTRIDITRKTATGYVFYEIKTYNNLKSSIREAIGQLFEYCLFPNVVEAEKIVLVSDVTPTTQIEQYLNHVKKFISIPFSYICFDADLGEIIVEI